MDDQTGTGGSRCVITSAYFSKLNREDTRQMNKIYYLKRHIRWCPAKDKPDRIDLFEMTAFDLGENIISARVEMENGPSVTVVMTVDVVLRTTGMQMCAHTVKHIQNLVACGI